MTFSSKQDIVKHLRSHTPSAYVCDQVWAKPDQLALCKPGRTRHPRSAPASQTHLAFQFID